MKEQFGLSPLIRLTLLSLYLALVLPLPLLAPTQLRLLMLLAVLFGFALVIGLLSERLVIDQDGLEVSYPTWMRWLMHRLFRRGWSMQWQNIKAIVPVGTSQGGTVYYLKTNDLNHQLLPQRIERFDRFLEIFRERTDLETTGIGRLTPPWTYQLLAVLAVLMVASEIAAGIALQVGWIMLPGGSPN
ncbi:MAG: hypothetical protein CL862_04915 [Cyanobium sp. NAT70]|nr:hypothetical protein [Cyanobium sp. NAT70]|tara:strand:- start:943 stop:1503 length:561 start_codon:yes stop_codon:yes gene_type:complete